MSQLKLAPSDEYLLQCLRQKLEGKPRLSSGGLIKEDKVYDCHPQIIIDRHGTRFDRFSCCVFTTTTRRRSSGNRCVRTNGVGGKWRATKGERPVYPLDQWGRYNWRFIIGHKTTLAYYDGQGRKTKWLMDEYVIKEFRDDDHSSSSSTNSGAAAAGGDHDYRSLKRKRVGEEEEEREVLDRWVVCYLRQLGRKRWPSKYNYLHRRGVVDANKVEEEEVSISTTTTTTTTAGGGHSSYVLPSEDHPDQTFDHAVTALIMLAGRPSDDSDKLSDDSDPLTLEVPEEWLEEEEEEEDGDHELEPPPPSTADHDQNCSSAAARNIVGGSDDGI